MTVQLVAVGIVMLVVAAAWVPTVSLPAGLFTTVLLRTFTDAPQLPNAVSLAANFAVGMLAVALMLRAWPSLRGCEQKLIAFGTVFVVAYVFVSWMQVGAANTEFTEIPRIVSILSVYALAAAVCREVGPDTVATKVLTAAAPSALLSIGSALGVGALGRADGRGQGTFVHPNAASAAFNACLLLALYDLLRRRRSIRTVPFVLLYGAAAVGTLSLGGLAGLAFGLLVVLLLWNRQAPSGRYLLALIGIPLAALAVLIFNSSLQQRLTSVDQGLSTGDIHVSSLEWRFQNWSVFLDLWREHTWLGWGWGTTDEYLNPIGKAPHSEPVRLLVETGVVGTAVIGAALIALVITLLRRINRGATYANAAVAVVISCVFQATASNMMRYTAAMYIVAGIVALALAEVPKPRTTATPAVHRVPARV